MASHDPDSDPDGGGRDGRDCRDRDGRDRAQSGHDDDLSHDTVRDRLRRALPAALKARDAVAVGALRSALAAIDNAEAVDHTKAVDAGQVPSAGVTHPEVAGTVAGLGAAEVERRRLTGPQMERIVRAEVTDREAAADHHRRAGQHETADRLRAEAEILRSYLDGGDR